MYLDDFNRKITRGRVTVTLRMEYDDDPDTSYLGSAESHREARYYDNRDAFYSYDGDCIKLPKSDVWRDRRGRIVAEPETLDWYNCTHSHRDIEFLRLTAENYEGVKGRLKYLFQDADRLRAYYRNDWYYVGIVATVKVDGREIGRASVWGYESDSDDSFLLAEGRGIASEAIAEAREFVQSVQKSA